MPSPLSLLLTPFLALLALPLLLSAYLTILLSLLALSIRLSLFYLDLVYAVISNYLIIPTSSDSLLSFRLSEPSTPTLSTSTAPRKQSQSQSQTSRPWMRRYHSYTNTNTNTGFISNLNPRSSANSFSSLISGDRHRDFENMGGWHYPTSYSETHLPNQIQPYHNHLSNSTSDLSASIDNPADPAADEKAWLSINQRLELPSLGGYRRGSFGSGFREGLGEGFGFGSGRESGTRKQGRHHRRSVTTSMLHGLPSTQSHSQSGATRGRLALGLVNRPDIPGADPDQGPGSEGKSHSNSINDGYVVLHLPSGSSMSTPKSAGSVDDRDGLGISRFM